MPNATTVTRVFSLVVALSAVTFSAACDRRTPPLPETTISTSSITISAPAMPSADATSAVLGMSGNAALMPASAAKR